MTILFVLIPVLATDAPMAAMGLVEANGNPIGTRGLIAFLLLPFALTGLLVLGWVRFVERRPLATIGLSRAGAALTSANGYTDLSIGALGTSLGTRMDKLDRELDQVGAMGAAFAIMAGNGATGGPNRVSAAFGLYGDKQAFAIGYGRQVGGRGAANFGLARSGKKTMGGGSFGLSW